MISHSHDSTAAISRPPSLPSSGSSSAWILPSSPSRHGSSASSSQLSDSINNNNHNDNANLESFRQADRVRQQQQSINFLYEFGPSHDRRVKDGLSHEQISSVSVSSSQLSPPLASQAIPQAPLDRMASATTDDSSSLGVRATESEGSVMIMPDAQPLPAANGEANPPTEAFVYPTPETFGPQYWERRRKQWLNGTLYPPRDGKQAPFQAQVSTTCSPLPLTSPPGRRSSIDDATESSLAHYFNTRIRAGSSKIPSFLANALPSSSRGSPTTKTDAETSQKASSLTSSTPSSPEATTSMSALPKRPSPSSSQALSYGQYQQVRNSPIPPGKAGNDALDRLEALLSPPGAEELDQVWKQGKLGQVWQFIMDGKPMKRGIRLGLLIKILRAGWIRDGTWPRSYTRQGADRRQLESLQNDPFFASPPRSPEGLDLPAQGEQGEGQGDGVIQQSAPT